MSLTALEQIHALNHSTIPAPSHFTISHLSPRDVLFSWEQPPTPSPSLHQYVLFLWLLNAAMHTNYSIANETRDYPVQLLQPYTFYQTALTALTHEGRNIICSYLIAVLYLNSYLNPYY